MNITETRKTYFALTFCVHSSAKIRSDEIFMTLFSAEVFNEHQLNKPIPYSNLFFFGGLLGVYIPDLGWPAKGKWNNEVRVD